MDLDREKSLGRKIRCADKMTHSLEGNVMKHHIESEGKIDRRSFDFPGVEK